MTGCPDPASDAAADDESSGGGDSSLRSGGIVFASNTDGNYEIYKMASDGSGLTRLTNNAVVDEHPAWSVDGLKIVFVSNANIKTMDADGTGVSGNLVAVGAASRRGFPTWSPDGTKIAYGHTENIYTSASGV